MSAVLLVVQFLVAIALTAVILMQRSEGGALGIGGGGGGMMSGRGAANMLTRTTMVLGAVFIANSILLAILSGVDTSNRSVIERAGEVQQDSDLPFGSFDTIPDDEIPSSEAETPAAPETDEIPGETPGEETPPADLPNR